MSEAQHDNLQNADGQDQIEQLLEPQVDSQEESQEEIVTSNQSVLEEIDNSNAEENEDDSVKEKHEIPVLDYDALSMEELTDELEKLVRRALKSLPEILIKRNPSITNPLIRARVYELANRSVESN